MREKLLASAWLCSQELHMIWQIVPVLLLVAFIAVLYWWLLKRSAGQIRCQYESLAERFGLDLTTPEAAIGGFVRPEPFVYGRYLGREVSISAPGKGLQNTRQTETVLKITLADSGFRLQILKNGLLGRIGQRDSGEKKRWLSGDAGFDALFDVRTNNSERMAVLFTPEVRQALLGLLEGSGASLYAGGGVIALVRPGLVADEDGRVFFEKAVELLCLLAEQIEEG